MKTDFLRSPHFHTLALGFIVWLSIFWRGLTTAYDVWIVSEIFNHCLLILPVVIYLIYEKWPSLTRQPLKPAPLFLVPFIALAGIQLFADIGDIKTIMHLASFLALPILLFALLGKQAATTIAFPLFFIVFAIPIGDQLIPYLQEITTDLAVPLLNLTGVPVYRNGLYLDIPEGRFLVAEACSGISFLITSITFGFLYSYLMFRSTKKRVTFVILSFLVPIAANALRVYGIILVGHLSDMEHAVGADHLIYGGVFYVIILFLLIVIGELMKEKKVSEAAIDAPAVTEMPKNFVGYSASLVVFAFALMGWKYNVSQQQDVAFDQAYTQQTTDLAIKPVLEHLNWQPKYDETLTFNLGKIEGLDFDIQYFSAYSGGKTGKILSSRQRPYDQQNWSLINREGANVDGKRVQVLRIVSPQGQTKTLLSWYKIRDRHFARASQAKLYQAKSKFVNKPAFGVSNLLLIEGNLPKETLENLPLRKIETGIFSIY